MAESMCGPVNPLQQFKQQTSLDRSLQQDRFSGRQHSAQGFRSHNHNVGSLDPEFEAFQAGRSVTPVLEHVSHFQAPANFMPPSQAPSWANDFQRMSLSPQAPMQQQPLHFPAGPSTSNWAQGFRDQYKQSAPRASSPSPLAFQQMARYGGNGFQSSLAQPTFAPEMHSTKGKAPINDTFDEAAFQRAFDLAGDDLMADADVETQGHVATNFWNATDTESADQVPMQEEQTEDLSDLRHQVMESQKKKNLLMESQERLLKEVQPDQLAPPSILAMQNLLMEQQKKEQELMASQEQLREAPQPEQLPNDDDALANTAQQLLEKVEHNQSDKFKNSQFLGLMRKLADRQVRVEGDKMVETADASSASYAGATLNAPSTETAPQIARDAQGEVSYGPLREQEYDPRMINPHDGEDVINLLNDPALADEIGPYTVPRTATDDVAYDPKFSEAWSRS